MNKGAARMREEGDGPRTVSELRRVIADLRRELRRIREERAGADLSDLHTQEENALLRLQLLEVCEERDRLVGIIGRLREGGDMATRKGSAKKAPTRKAAKRGSGKRTTIAPKGDTRYIRRDAEGRITESDDKGKSLKQDRLKKAKKVVRPGDGDQGDQAVRKGAGKKSGSKRSSSKKR